MSYFNESQLEQSIIALLQEQDYEFLYDFNFEIMQKMCELLDIHPHVLHSEKFRMKSVEFATAHDVSAKGIAVADSTLYTLHSTKPYYQVFAHKFGFQPNLSILDLLFCMGPEAIFYL